MTELGKSSIVGDNLSCFCGLYMIKSRLLCAMSSIHSNPNQRPVNNESGSLANYQPAEHKGASFPYTDSSLNPF